MEISREDLMDEVSDVVGAAVYIKEPSKSGLTLFILTETADNLRLAETAKPQTIQPGAFAFLELQFTNWGNVKQRLRMLIGGLAMNPAGIG